ncbi:MAG: hypothetical protein GY788_28115, partial [bacterium]|nr:hypothetical protein [bacterium]
LVGRAFQAAIVVVAAACHPLTASTTLSADPVIEDDSIGATAVSAKPLRGGASDPSWIEFSPLFREAT